MRLPNLLSVTDSASDIAADRSNRSPSVSSQRRIHDCRAGNRAELCHPLAAANRYRPCKKSSRDRLSSLADPAYRGGNRQGKRKKEKGKRSEAENSFYK